MISFRMTLPVLLAGLSLSVFLPVERLSMAQVAPPPDGLSAQIAPPPDPSIIQSDTLTIANPQDVIDAFIGSSHMLRSKQLLAEASAQKSGYVSVFPDPTLAFTAQPMPVYTARGKQVVGVRLEQMIPFSGKRQLMRDMADLEAQMGLDMARSYAAETILEAQLALNEIWRIDRRKAVIRQFIARLNQFEGLTLSKYEVGDGSQQAILKIQLERSRLDQAMLELDRQREGNRLKIERLVQLPVRIAPPANGDLNPTNPELDLESRSDIKLLERSREQALLQQNMLGYYNRPDVGVSLNWIGIVESDMPASSDGRDALAVGVAVRIPLGQAANRSRQQETQIRAEAIAEQLESVRQSIETMLREVRSQQDFDRRSLELLDNSLLPAVNNLTESSLSSYSTGKSEFLDLLDSERSRFQLELERIELMSKLSGSRLLQARISGNLDVQIADQF